uniref:Uncharacterized protein n=1 Tax=Lotus japonicus TaxID=34305 RepID=I3SJV6_LOTJA|nr:unknown [Lotus japonicus]
MAKLLAYSASSSTIALFRGVMGQCCWMGHQGKGINQPT